MKKRSTFNLSHIHDTTCKMGELFPVACMEAIPGDTFDGNIEALCRLMALRSPAYTNIKLKYETFFVPIRLIWPDFEKFWTGGADGEQAPVYPTIKTEKGFEKDSLADHFGLPVGVPNLEVSALQFRAINQIYNDWYMNQNIEQPRVISLESGLDETTDLSMMYRSWNLDYFTRNLPWAQRGDPMYLPFATTAPVLTTDKQTLLNLEYTGSGQQGLTTGGLGYGDALGVATGSGQTLQPGVDSGYIADLAQAAGVSIDDMRSSVQMQLALSLLARGGARYVEAILSFFGVRVPDYRLQRAEFLGGGSSVVQIAEVLQTSSSDNTSPQGNMAGRGITYNNAARFKYFVQEYGYIITMCSVVPDARYMQGVERQFNRRTRWDIPVPLFQHLGEQKTLLKELYAQGTEADEQTFGFNGRYEELKRIPSKVSAEFRDTLKFWSLVRDFESAPALNEDFIKCHPSDRIFATVGETATDPCLLSIVHHVRAKRPLARYAVPGYMDHYF